MIQGIRRTVNNALNTHPPNDTTNSEQAVKNFTNWNSDCADSVTPMR